MTFSYNIAPQKKMIGYARVSTDSQESDLEYQIRDMNTFADQLGRPFDAIYEDIGSAHKRNSFDALVGLQDALKLAQDHDTALYVREVSRLSRNVKEFLDHIQPSGVPIFSLKHGRVLDGQELLKEIAQAERNAKAVADGTKSAVASRKKRDLSGSEMRRRAMREVIERQMRVEEDVIVAVRILRPNPNMTARELGHELIRQGRRPPRGEEFTLDTARARRTAAMKQLELEDEVHAEVALLAANDMVPGHDDSLVPMGVNNATFEARRAAKPGVSDATARAKQTRPPMPTGTTPNRPVEPAGRRYSDSMPQRRPTLPLDRNGAWRPAPGVWRSLLLAGIPKPPPEPKERPPPSRIGLRSADVATHPFRHAL